MNRVFGRVEAIFDVFYLLAALIAGIVLLATSPANSARMLAGCMALVLAGGDAFHLVPRITAIFTGHEESLRRALGTGKQITSITMTIFYLFLWQIGLMLFPSLNANRYTGAVYLLAILRIVLCLMPQNKWIQKGPPVRWGIYRNIPFFIQGTAVAILFAYGGNTVSNVRWIWLAIAISFACYLPVVLWSNYNAKIGMLMLPKTCAYLWIIAMFLPL